MNESSGNMIRNESEWPRLLPIDNSHNLRDMGGYRAADGRVVKWRHLYRSGQLTGLSEAGHSQLAALGVKMICDLRGKHERDRLPMIWHRNFDIQYWSRDYDLRVGNDLKEVAQKRAPSPDEILATIHGSYRHFPFEQADSYRELFRRLAAGHVPLLFNCSAGKDRTGVAAALILWALGIPRETIAEDYALTDHAIDRLVEIFLDDPRYAYFSEFPRQLYLPLLRADPTYLDTMFDEIEARHGSVASYMKDVLGVGDAEMQALRMLLLES
jgi:protein-tyrosine phosphatase